MPSYDDDARGAVRSHVERAGTWYRAPRWMGSVALCIGGGGALLCAGLYFLLDPVGDRNAVLAGTQVLALGQAFTVAGAVLLGFGIRPR